MLRKLTTLAIGFTVFHAAAQAQTAAKPSTQPPPKQSQTMPAGVTPPAGYVIGSDDALAIRFWSDTQLSVDVVVRTDGKISIPLLNDIQASGFTPEELALELEKAATKYITEPDATVIVREIRSRRVYVIGQGVAKSGVVLLNSNMDVLQVLAAAGGLVEYADKKNIVIIRKEGGKERRMKFNFDDVVKGKNLQQNVLLQPGDTVVVN
jgi:polysaccharide export outer membrane protein